MSLIRYGIQKQVQVDVQVDGDYYAKYEVDNKIQSLESELSNAKEEGKKFFDAAIILSESLNAAIEGLSQASDHIKKMREQLKIAMAFVPKIEDGDELMGGES